MGLIVGGRLEEFRVSGVATMSGPAWVYVTGDRAATLPGHSGRIDAIGLRTAPSAGLAAIRRLAADAGAETYTGADRGWAEQPAAGGDRDLLVEAGGSFGGYVLPIGRLLRASPIAHIGIKE